MMGNGLGTRTIEEIYVTSMSTHTLTRTLEPFETKTTLRSRQPHGMLINRNMESNENNVPERRVMSSEE